ncbi:endo-1,4-beta-xylanase [Olivibacter ginsenosidimutans]|uniref:Beta-xylanase n=2 Tax=Olivibacter ginsenosidimutans TaxID=1176537 RepID=A0ABP9AVC0_9SPHI
MSYDINDTQNIQSKSDSLGPNSSDSSKSIVRKTSSNRDVRKVSGAPQYSLKDAYRNYFPIGAAVLPNQINNSKIANLITTQFSSITAANDMKPTYLQPKEGVFNFNVGDKIVSFATKNNMKVRGHTLVWPRKMPKWFYYSQGKAVGKDLLLKRIETHVNTVVQHYKGKTYCWDVVNEAIPFFGPNPLDSNKDSLYIIAGEEYFDKAFYVARKADPNAKLFYNDNGFEWKKKRDRIFEYLKKAKARGVPIDGVGMQGHWGIDGISEAYLRETIKMFSSIGLEVQITELDISIYPIRSSGKVMKAADLKSTSDAYTEQIQTKQAQIYSMIFRVCREMKGQVTGITLWSPYDWANYLTKRMGKKNYPYLFDENLQPKKSFHDVVNF